MAKKKLENMTTDERIEHYYKEREKERKERSAKLACLSEEQRDVANKLYQNLEKVLEIALYPQMGGIRYVSAFDLQELQVLSYDFSKQFNLRD